MVHTGVARPYSACRSGSGLNEGLGISAPSRWLPLFAREEKTMNDEDKGF